MYKRVEMQGIWAAVLKHRVLIKKDCEAQVGKWTPNVERGHYRICKPDYQRNSEAETLGVCFLFPPTRPLKSSSQLCL